MKKPLLILIITLCCLSVFATNEVNSRIIDPQSEIYDYMDMLYSLNNKVKPETNRPWSEAQARLIFSNIDKESQSGVALELYNQIDEILNDGQRWNFSDFAFSVVPEVNIEFYAHSNSEDFTTEEQFVRSFAERKPWFKIGFDFSVSDFFYSVSDMQWRTARGSHKDVWKSYTDDLSPASDGNYYIGSFSISDATAYPVSDYYFKRSVGTNINFDTYDFSFIWPVRAIVSVGGKNWNLSINRDRMKIGDAHFANLLVDDYSDYNDFFSLTFFSKNFSYYWYLMPLNTNMSQNESTVSTNARLFMIHTLDFRIFDRVNLKVSENVMYQYDVFDLSFMNPAFIYHNLNNRSMFNSIAYMEVNASIFKGLDVYVEFALDQARAPNEGDNQADASGLVAGLEYTTAAFGGVFENYIEIAQTTPLLYRRDLIDFVKASSYYHQGSANTTDSGDSQYYGHYTEFEYIGFPFGGDAQVLSLGTNFTIPGLLEAGLSATAVQLGSMRITKSHNTDGNNNNDANIKGNTPTVDENGNITRALVISATAEFDLENYLKYPDVSFEAEADYVVVSLYNKESESYSNTARDLQLTLSLSCKF